jgi:hypothetical protein
MVGSPGFQNQNGFNELHHPGNGHFLSSVFPEGLGDQKGWEEVFVRSELEDDGLV